MLPFMATKEEVSHSRNVIICWAIGLFVASGALHYFPLGESHNVTTTITQPLKSS